MKQISETVYTAARSEMVREQLEGRKIRDPRVLAAMRTVPRHWFVPDELRHLAYTDRPLAIGENQTISQPYIVALMCQLMALKGNEKVLEIGTGSGYQAAILGLLAAKVYTVELIDSLAERAGSVVKQSGAQNVQVIQGDGSAGLAEYAPYDAVVIAAAAPRVSRAILEQLVDGGRLVIPVGDANRQQLQLIVRTGGRFQRRKLVSVAFVPMRGVDGWSEEDWTANEDV